MVFAQIAYPLKKPIFMKPLKRWSFSLSLLKLMRVKNRNWKYLEFRSHLYLILILYLRNHLVVYYAMAYIELKNGIFQASYSPVDDQLSELFED